MRKSYLDNIEQADKICANALWEGTIVKNVVGEAFEDRIKKYEKKNGPVKPKPRG